jgi:hypothetical protein
MPIRDLALFPERTDSYGDFVWLTKNVEYIYGSILAGARIECARVSRLNMILHPDPVDESSGVDFNAIYPEVRTHFPVEGFAVDDPIASQARLSSVITAALKRICPRSDEALDAIHTEVLATGFSVDSYISRKWVKSPEKKYSIKIGMTTGFLQTRVFVDRLIKRGNVRRNYVFAGRPSPRYCESICFKDLIVSDEGIVEIVLKHPGDEIYQGLVFGSRYYDTRNCDVVSEVEDEGDVVIRFSCAQE